MLRDPNLTEEALIALYRQSGNSEWLGELLQRHTVLLLGVAMKYLKEGEAAADAVQSVFLKALTHFPAGEIQNLKGWLYILLRNHCLQLLRDQQRHLPEEALDRVAAPLENGMQMHLEKEATLQQLEVYLQSLPAEQRIVIQLFYLERRSYAEVQAATGYTFKQVKSFIQNGKRALRGRFSQNPTDS